MKIKKLLRKMKIDCFDVFNHKIKKITDSSKNVDYESVFFLKENNEDYFNEAIKKGAKTVFIPYSLKTKKFNKINLIYVEDVEEMFALALKILYLKKIKKLKIIGVTGTNGKTTTTTLLYKYLRYIKKKCTLIGTNGIFINDTKYLTINTTPGINKLYEILLLSLKKKVKYVVMEVSSHAIKMNRIKFIPFYATLISNITLDHLDYHKTFIDYKYTKALFVCKGIKEVFINKDIEEFGFIKNLCDKYKTYGFNKSDFQIFNCENKSDKSNFSVKVMKQTYNIETNLLGVYNVYNICSFMCLAYSINLLNKNVEYFLKNNIRIDGRMEKIEKNDRIFIIDFAHTPDGINNVLSFLKKVKENQLITVVGCGGDRDKNKRNIIGQIALEKSDYVVFTSDNPRYEKPESIIKQITKNQIKDNFISIIDRKEAILEAYKMSSEKDIIAILGKGNESYIEIKGIKYDYSDFDVVNSL